MHARPGLTAMLRVIGTGYKVGILVNGKDVGVRSAPAEDRQLFSKSHPKSSTVPPEFRKNLVVLRHGPTQIVVNFKKTEEAGDSLTVELYAAGPKPVFTLTTSAKAHGKVNRTLNLASASVMALTDADVRV